MKRTVVWLLIVGVIATGVAIGLQAAEKKGKVLEADKPAQPVSQRATVASQPAPAADEKIAFTFQDETQMREFARLWQQRQLSMTKMAVLQSYLKEEDAVLTTTDQELLSKYNLDVNKNYSLDTNRKVLLERPAPPQPAGVAQPSAPVQPSATP